jgi:hypothetical protein
MWGKAFKTDKRKKSLLASKHILQPCVVVFVFVIFLASVPFLHIWQYKLKGGQNHSFVPFFKVCTCAMYKNMHVHAWIALPGYNFRAFFFKYSVMSRLLPNNNCKKKKSFEVHNNKYLLIYVEQLRWRVRTKPKVTILVPPKKSWGPWATIRKYSGSQ